VLSSLVFVDSVTKVYKFDVEQLRIQSRSNRSSSTLSVRPLVIGEAVSTVDSHCHTSENLSKIDDARYPDKERGGLRRHQWGPRQPSTLLGCPEDN
jgi:hypothetical protein